MLNGPPVPLNSNGTLPVDERGQAQLRSLLERVRRATGRILGLAPCVYFNCLLRGCSEEESHPCAPYLCPVCLRKLHWNIGFDVLDRYHALEAFYAKCEGLFAQALSWTQKRLADLAGLGPTAIQGLKEAEYCYNVSFSEDVVALAGPRPAASPRRVSSGVADAVPPSPKTPPKTAPAPLSPGGLGIPLSPGGIGIPPISPARMAQCQSPGRTQSPANPLGSARTPRSSSPPVMNLLRKGERSMSRTIEFDGAPSVVNSVVLLDCDDVMQRVRVPGVWATPRASGSEAEQESTAPPSAGACAPRPAPPTRS